MVTGTSILQRGNIYFFYRPKVEHLKAHSLEEVQRFFMIIQSDDNSFYSTLVVGRKQMPEIATYFSFVKKVTSNIDELLNSLKEDAL